MSPIAWRAAFMRLVRVEFRDDASLPDRGNQVVLADHAVTIADEVLQEVKNERLNGDQHAPVPQLAPIRVERIVLKAVDQLSTFLASDLPRVTSEGKDKPSEAPEKAIAKTARRASDIFPIIARHLTFRSTAGRTAISR